jgi:two-component system chemotaxis sensor kinase CheA
MPDPDREFQQRLLVTFRGEAEEHLHAISSGLIDLEHASGLGERAPIVEKVFREAHSLKGAARAVNLKEIETICQSLEEVLARAKRQEIEVATDVLDVMHRNVDEIERLLGQPERGPRSSGDLPERSSRGQAEIDGAGGPGIEVALPRARLETKVAEETVRVPTDQLDRLLLQVEELVPQSMGVAHSSARLQELVADVSLWKHEWAKVQFAAKALDRRGTGARRLIEFLEWNDEFFRTLEGKLNDLSRSSEHDQRSLGAMVDSLLRDTKLLLLRPFSSLTESFPKIARDLCREQGKEASLSVRGADIEIDRRILQEIKDPLIHILRNCIDHGIEKPEDRARAKKAPQGTITIAIERKSANRVEIAISDDGAGINPQSVRDAAVRAGVVSAESAPALQNSEILQFIFQSGVSTSPIVTDISGRGLGMAIVREKVERLGGEVILDTRLGAGTTIRLLLPLTVSTMRGLLVRAGEQNFVIPVAFVERVASAGKESIQTIENRATALVGGQAVSFVSLHDVLGLSGSGREDPGSVSMVVLAASEMRIAFHVDEVIDEQEVLVKSLGPQLVRVRNVTGAAVLGTGKLVPILNVADLMKSAVKTASVPAPAKAIEESSASRRGSILVVDDSITARTLLKSILEAAGYLVRTAVDGAEAFATLREMNFDVVVSDVDMPRLNGFDLTARIRSDKKLADLPVILVTALESRQDRERGIDVGANAYIVKSSFEQSNLLEVLHRYV